MRTTRRRALGGITAGALLLGLAACDSGGDAPEATPGEDALADKRVGAMEDYGVGDTFVATEPVEFGLLYRDHPNYPLNEDWLFFTHLAEQNKVTFDITTAPLSDWEQRRSLLVGAGDAPAIIPVTYPGQESAFVASGAILPVSDYVDLMPNFQDKVQKWGMDAELDTLRQEDGKFYLLPGLLEKVRPDYTVALRTDVLEAGGGEEPETWDDLATSLEALKEESGADYAWSDRWQGNALLNVAAASFGTVAGWGFGPGVQWDDEAGEFVFAGATDEYKSLVEYFRGLVEADLMDPESFTQEDDAAIQKLANEQSLAITTNAQELIGNRATMTEVGKAKDFTLEKIRVPAGPAGDLIGGTRLESGIMISSDALESENFVAMMQFIDWLYYSDEGLEFARWGVEGETFEREGDKRVLAEDVEFLGQNPDGSKNLQMDFGFFNGVFSLAHGSTQDLVLTHLTEEELAWQEEMADKEVAPLAPPWPLTPQEREQVSLYQTALTDTVTQNTLAFITGQRDIAEWDAYVAELEGQNMAAYLEVVNGAQKRFAENNG